jgi:hypothetical protein
MLCYRVVLEFDALEAHTASNKLTNKETRLPDEDIHSLIEQSYKRSTATVYVCVPPFIEFNPVEAACAQVISEDRSKWPEWNVLALQVEHLGPACIADVDDPIWVKEE